ncbi:MAG: hypothetical protein Q4P24_16080 [Rhodobacterales bacterium]|nr:hypothetical protein [Rhodobacterales bacterium]
MTIEKNIRRWTAKRKTAPVVEVVQGKTAVAGASWPSGLPPSEIEGWGGDAKRGVENSLRANPLDLREQYGKRLKDLQDACGEALAGAARPKKAAGPHGAGRTAIDPDGTAMPLPMLCEWFGGPRRTVCCKPRKAALKVDLRFAEPIKALIEAGTPLVTGRSQGCSGSARTRCSEYSGSRVGSQHTGCRHAPMHPGRAFRRHGTE